MTFSKGSRLRASISQFPKWMRILVSIGLALLFMGIVILIIWAILTSEIFARIWGGVLAGLLVAGTSHIIYTEWNHLIARSGKRRHSND